MMNRDAKILRALMEQYREYAHSDRNLKMKELHIALNDLKMTRPVLLIDELPWHELNRDGELTLQCADPFLRETESYLRQMLYRYRHIPGDMVLPQEFKVSKVISSSGIGISVKEDVKATDENNRIVSHRFIDQMADESCLELLHNEEIMYDREESERRFEMICEIAGDILPVRLVGSPWCFDTLWDDVATLHGVGQILVDLLDRPEYMHALAQKLTDIFLDKVRQYEEMNLFEGYQDSVHCTSAYTSELPAPGFDGEHFRAKDVWGRGAAQVFVSVSPAMREEFDIPYMSRAMEPFGLVYYGCCEPLHNQIDIISKIPHLRKITVTPWADYDLAAEQIGKRYVYSAKASPAAVALKTINEDQIRRELKRITDACYRNGCNFELVLKDVSTVSYHPEHLERWEKIAREFIPDC
ncbi:MAG: hypothetical protein J6S83_11740 [Lachnospiraceae bacterium]|nr:hypothetical protein [Lachnospiraceae bacterium]